VTELFEQAEDISIKSLLPTSLTRTKVATRAHRINSSVEGGRVLGQHAPFAVADNTDCWILRTGLFREPIDAGQDLLQFISDDMPSEFERTAIDVLAVREIRAPLAARRNT